MDTKKLGNLGERIACEYLVKKGYKILSKNYGISFGEIDIIAKKRRSLSAFLRQGGKEPMHFIEVKTIIGSNNNFFPEEKVDYKKRRKLRQLTEIWLEKNKYPQDYPYQIDAIGILINKEAKKARVSYFENVVEET